MELTCRRIHFCNQRRTFCPNRKIINHSVVVGLFAVILTLFGSGCAYNKKFTPVAVRPFDFQQDTFSYSNQLVWEYSFNTNGEWQAHKREPKPEYALHCFVMTRAAERFFFNADFEASLPATDDAVYRQRIHSALEGKSGQVFPGYANLREFSVAKDALLKEECGGAWRSYFQRGNWRLVFPFSRAHQQKTAKQLTAALQSHHLPIVHLARFPQQTINHAILLYDLVESDSEIRFTAYDPNIISGPVVLTYNRLDRTFYWPRSHYFGGGRVDVYQIYHKWDY